MLNDAHPSTYTNKNNHVSLMQIQYTSLPPSAPQPIPATFTLIRGFISRRIIAISRHLTTTSLSSASSPTSSVRREVRRISAEGR